MKRYWGIILGLAALALLLVIASRTAQAAGPPPMPHPASLGVCSTCHGASGAKPAPANHTAFKEDSCQSCHQPAAASTPAVTSTPAPVSSPAPTNTNPSNACLGCHGQAGLTMNTTSGEKIPLSVDAKVFAGSVHGGKLLCTDCHTGIAAYPHPKNEVKDARQYSLAQYELCKRCHFDNYTKTLDSAHYKILSEGNLKAPLCTDCHGAHDVAPPSQPRSKISQTCSRCHQEVNKSYASSVHGKALIEENNFDVPVCTDCHLSHTIEDPRTASFRLRSVELCSSCHSNGPLMKKYGISTNVVQTYLQDFHGRTVALENEGNRNVWVKEAVCTDCHGVHDIQTAASANSPVIKANLVGTCQGCHPDATPNFPSAWLSHYEPSPTQSPLVFYARWFYRLMIPFILIGLSVHILLDLWKTITNR